MTMNNDNRHRCKTCEKFINKKLFLNKDGFCLKCFYRNHPDKNLKKKENKKKTKKKNIEKEYKRLKCSNEID